VRFRAGRWHGGGACGWHSTCAPEFRRSRRPTAPARARPSWGAHGWPSLMWSARGGAATWAAAAAWAWCWRRARCSSSCRRRWPRRRRASSCVVSVWRGLYGLGSVLNTAQNLPKMPLSPPPPYPCIAVLKRLQFARNVCMAALGRAESATKYVLPNPKNSRIMKFKDRYGMCVCACVCVCVRVRRCMYVWVGLGWVGLGWACVGLGWVGRWVVRWVGRASSCVVSVWRGGLYGLGGAGGTNKARSNTCSTLPSTCPRCPSVHPPAPLHCYVQMPPVGLGYPSRARNVCMAAPGRAESAIKCVLPNPETRLRPPT
jgi:hypothetical protein